MGNRPPLAPPTTCWLLFWEYPLGYMPEMSLKLKGNSDGDGALYKDPWFPLASAYAAAGLALTPWCAWLASGSTRENESGAVVSGVSGE